MVPVRYVFRSEQGGLQMIGNFYIEPLIHIKDPDPNKNKRVIKVNNAEQNKSYYVEMASSAMIDFAQFKKVLFCEGGNIFIKGKSQHHEAIYFGKWEKMDEQQFAIANTFCLLAYGGGSQFVIPKLKDLYPELKRNFEVEYWVLKEVKK